jgi:hypothetical protein
VAWASVLRCAAMIAIPVHYVAHVARCKRVKLLVAAKDDDGDFDIAEDGKLVRLLE